MRASVSTSISLWNGVHHVYTWTPPASENKTNTTKTKQVLYQQLEKASILYVTIHSIAAGFVALKCIHGGWKAILELETRRELDWLQPVKHSWVLIDLVWVYLGLTLRAWWLSISTHLIHTQALVKGRLEQRGSAALLDLGQLDRKVAWVTFSEGVVCFW